MKFLILAALVACASARPQGQDFQAEILKSDSKVGPEAFQYAYETSNGISAQAEGVVKNPDSEYPSLDVSGNYKYTAPNGEPVEVTYTANEEGYQAQGSYVPTPPPIPDAILRSIEYNSKYSGDHSVVREKSNRFS